jgi:hypothetical protein
MRKKLNGYATFWEGTGVRYIRKKNGVGYARPLTRREVFAFEHLVLT